MATSTRFSALPRGINSRWVDAAPGGNSGGRSVLLSGQYVLAAGDAGSGAAVARLFNNKPPVARFSSSVTPPSAQFNFDASPSSDRDGSVAG